VIKVNYTDYQEIMNEVIDYLDNPYHDYHIISVFRGSLPIGTEISNRLDLPLSIVKMQTRNGDDKIPELIYNDGIVSNQTLILVDDIYDSGLTIDKIISYLKVVFPNNKIQSLCLYENNTIKKPNHVITFRKTDGKWVIFPWED